MARFHRPGLHRSVGTGFSRSLVPEAEAKKQFYATTPDIEYLSRVIYDWLLKNGRLSSRKYLVGESYGGFRGPASLTICRRSSA